MSESQHPPVHQEGPGAPHKTDAPVHQDTGTTQTEHGPGGPAIARPTATTHPDVPTHAPATPDPRYPPTQQPAQPVSKYPDADPNLPTRVVGREVEHDPRFPKLGQERAQVPGPTPEWVPDPHRNPSEVRDAHLPRPLPEDIPGAGRSTTEPASRPLSEKEVRERRTLPAEARK